MQNAQVAQVFDSIADCLEIAGDNPFKIRAYRRAAEAVASYPNPIEDASEAGTLRAIEGLGEATIAKTQEFLATGKVRLLEHLREEYPPSLLELLHVPGLGPKRVRVLRDQGVTTLDELKIAIEAGTLKMGKGFFTPKIVDGIRQGIERLAEQTTRLPLGDAKRVSREIAASLSEKTGAHVEIGGSTRRGCDLVGDLNLLIETSDNARALDAFVGLSSVLSVEAREVGSALVRARPGIEVRLECASQEQFGAAWLHATGSKAHLEGARKQAATLGLELRRDGLFRGAERLPARDEAEIYRALGAQLIAPELREGRGEWEAATRDALPQLVELSDIKGDLHTHSTWSDGSVSIRGMAEAARARGYAYFAVTDHSKALAMTNGLNAQRLREQAQEIAQVQGEFPDLKILRGIECDILRDGSLDLDDEILHELDWVVASVHSAFNLDEGAQTARMIRALSHPAVDMVAHPTGRILGGRPGYNVHVPALIEAARATSTALEINSSERLDLSDENSFLARESGVLLCINSDAHSPRMMDNIDLGVTTARRAWCRASDVLNAKPLDELLAWLKRPQAR